MVDSGVYLKLNEGLGGAYERIAYTDIITRIAGSFGCKKVLELNATYIAGIPAFNSCILAQRGFDVTVLVKPRDWEDANEVWRMTGLLSKVHLIQYTDDGHIDLPDKSYDMVWNHLAFEQYADPGILIDEMKRMSRELVMTLTLSPYNYGYMLHRVAHAFRKEEWNHGRASNCTIHTMKRIHKAHGLEVIETGACDCPPWMDTVNEVIGKTMTYADTMPVGIRDQWSWCSANPECQEHRLVKLFLDWERLMPTWFKVYVASHHLYCASAV